MKKEIIFISLFCLIVFKCNSQYALRDGRYTNTIYFGYIARNDSTYLVMAGDFDVSNAFDSNGIRNPSFIYDENFWYFKTRKGKKSLKYLKKINQGTQSLMIKKICHMQRHIIKYYLMNINKMSKEKQIIISNKHSSNK